MVGWIGVGKGRATASGIGAAGSDFSTGLLRGSTVIFGETLRDCGGGSEENLCARLVEERVRARISARSLSWPDTEEWLDAGAWMDGAAEPMDELIDTDDDDGGPDNLGVSIAGAGATGAGAGAGAEATTGGGLMTDG